jgi:hypothetical protein
MSNNLKNEKMNAKNTKKIAQLNQQILDLNDQIESLKMQIYFHEMENENDMDVKSMELYVSPMRERNLDKFGHASDQCICCGKMMNQTDEKFVHMGVDWLAYNTDETTRIDGFDFITGTDTETQGFHRIGNDCAKKMNGFTFTYKH